MAGKVIPPRGNANRNPRLADGTRYRDQLTMPVKVNICPMCKRVAPRLYPSKRGQIKVMVCGECKGKF